VEFAGRLRGGITRLASAVLRGTKGRLIDPGGLEPRGLESTVARSRALLAHLYSSRVRGAPPKMVVTTQPCYHADPRALQGRGLVVKLAEALCVREDGVSVLTRCH